MRRGGVSGDPTALLLGQPGLSYEYDQIRTACASAFAPVFLFKGGFTFLWRHCVTSVDRTTVLRCRARVTGRWKRAEGLDDEVNLRAKSRTARSKGGLSTRFWIYVQAHFTGTGQKQNETFPSAANEGKLSCEVSLIGHRPPRPPSCSPCLSSEAELEPNKNLEGLRHRKCF